MSINNRNNLEVIEACPSEKRNFALETLLCAMKSGNYFKLLTLRDRDGRKVNPSSIADVKLLKIIPKDPSYFYVKAVFPKASIGEDLEVFSKQVKDAIYYYSVKSSFVAMYCCKGDHNERTQLKSIKELPHVELRVLHNVCLSDRNIVITNEPKVLTHFEIANRIGFDGWLPHKPLSSIGDCASVIDVHTVPPILSKLAKSIGKHGNPNFDYVVGSIVGLTGAVLAQDFRVAVNNNSVTYESPNIWVMNVGHPASGKSPIMLAALSNASSCVYQRDEGRERKADMAKQAINQRIKVFLNQTIKSNDEEGESYASIDQLEEECKAKIDKVLPAPIHDRGIHITTDTTLAALYKLMLLGRPIAYVADEGGAFFKSLERPDATSSALRGVFLNSESGNGRLSVSRANQDDKLIDKAAVSVLAGIQPDVLGPYISAAQLGHGNDGLLNRFLWMVLPVTAIDDPLVSGGFSKLKAITCKKFFDALAKWDPKRDANFSGEHLLIHFSSKAQEDYENLVTYIQKERSKYSQKHLMHSQLGKYEALSCKLALIFQVFLNYDVDTETFKQIECISTEAFSYVEETIAYLMSHAMTIFGVEGMAQQEEAKQLFEKLKKKGANKKMSVSEMAQCNWKGFSGRGDEAKETIQDALHYLEKLGLVKPIDKGSATLWQINPKAIW